MQLMASKSTTPKINEKSGTTKIATTAASLAGATSKKKKQISESTKELAAENTNQNKAETTPEPPALETVEPITPKTADEEGGLAALDESLRVLQSHITTVLGSLGEPLLLQRINAFKEEIEGMCRDTFNDLTAVDEKVEAHQFTLEQMALRHFFEQFCEQVMPAFTKISPGAEWGIHYAMMERDHSIPASIVDAYRLGLNSEGIRVEGVKSLVNKKGELTVTAFGAAVHLVEMDRLDASVLDILPPLDPRFSIDNDVEDLLNDLMAERQAQTADPMFG
jgi:hypothetical protein